MIRPPRKVSHRSGGDEVLPPHNIYVGGIHDPTQTREVIKMKFVIITQSNLETINVLNGFKQDQFYCVLNEGNGFSTICQYSRQYDSFKIITCKTSDLDPSKRLRNGDAED